MARRDVRVRIAFDFGSAAEAAAFMQELRHLEVIPGDVGAYEMDSLDRTKSAGGIGNRDTYIVRRVGDRPEQTRLKAVMEVDA